MKGTRAYLVLNNPASGVKSIVTFDGVADGIESPAADELNGSDIYDLSGRRVSNPARGIYIMNGKKVIVIWVLAGDRRPYKIPEHVTAKHKTPKYFIRYNSSTIEAKGENEIELFELANRVPFDDRGNLTAKISDVSMLLIREFLNQVQSKLLDDIEDAKPHDVLEQMGLLDGPIESERVKNVALMMFS